MIRPVEMQMLLPRTESVATEQQHENQHIVNGNQFAAGEVAKEMKHNSETVIQKDANAFAEYKYDAKEEGNGTYQNPRKRRRSKKVEQDSKDSGTILETGMNDKQPRVNIQI